jgi:hypothetical protein
MEVSRPSREVIVQKPSAQVFASTGGLPILCTMLSNSASEGGYPNQPVKA